MAMDIADSYSLPLVSSSPAASPAPTLVENPVTNAVDSVSPAKPTEHTTAASEAAPEEEEELYEVESIVNHRRVRGTVEYLIKWKGYTEEWNTWEPRNNLNCTSLVRQYYRSLNKSSPPVKPTLKSTLDKFLASNSTPTTTPSPPLLASPPVTHPEPVPVQPSASTPKAQPPAATDTPWLPLKQEIPQNPAAGIRKTVAPAKRGQRLRRGLHSESIDVVRMKPNIRRFLDAISHAKGPPISVVNEVDDDGPPLTFTYIDKSIIGPTITPPDPSTALGCQCPHNCDGLSSTHECLCTSHTEGQCAYDLNGRLTLAPGFPIYECNSKCRCGPRCPNRVIQKGPQVKVEIFKTVNKGWGVRARQAIPKGTFIAEYVGEIINAAEADRRAEVYDGIGITYLFDLDHEVSAEQSPEYTIDAYHCGNFSHFFNHSCDPNLAVYAAYTEHWDPRFHHLAFFAKRSIVKHEELTFDYGGSIDKEPGEAIAVKQEVGQQAVTVIEGTLPSLAGDGTAMVIDVTGDGFAKKVIGQVAVPTYLSTPAPSEEAISVTMEEVNQKASMTLKCHCGSKKCRQYVHV